MYPKLKKPLSLFLMTTHLSLRNCSVQTEIAIITEWCITSFLAPHPLHLGIFGGKVNRKLCRKQGSFRTIECGTLATRKKVHGTRVEGTSEGKKCREKVCKEQNYREHACRGEWYTSSIAKFKGLVARCHFFFFFFLH
jgi:hypothetical protein